MSDFYWPKDIVPNTVQWKLIDNSAVFSSPLSGAVRTVSRPGTRLGCSLSFTSQQTTNRHRVMGLIAALRGRTNRIWLSDVSSPVRGSFPSAELLTNTTFSSTAGWTSSAAELALSAETGRMRLSRTGVVADAYASAPVTTASGNAYLYRAGVLKGYGANSYALQLGTTTTGAELVAGASQSLSGYQQVSAIASGATSYAVLRDYSATRSADNFQILDTPSVSRCALVNGASQTGSGLWLKNLPVSTAGLLTAGDMVSIYTGTWEMKRVTADLNSNASGNGYLIFEPSLRVSPSANAPVSIWRPMSRFLLANGETNWSTTPGLFSDFTLEFVEDLT